MSEQRVTPERFLAVDAEVKTARFHAERFSANNSLQKRLGIVTIPDKLVFSDYLATLATDQDLAAVDKKISILNRSRFLTRRILGLIPRTRQKNAEKRRDVLLDAQVYLFSERNDHIDHNCRTKKQRQSAFLVMDALDNLFDRTDRAGAAVRINSGVKVKEEVLATWQEEWRDKLQQVG